MYLEQIQTLQTQDEQEIWSLSSPEDDEPIEAPQEIDAPPQQNPDKEYAARMKCLLRSISQSPLLAAYRLQPQELALVAEICHKTRTNSEQDFNIREICAMTPGFCGGLKEQFSHCLDLIDREIFSPTCRYERDYRYDLPTLYDANLRLNGLLWNLILGQDPIRRALQLHSKALAQPGSAVHAVLKMLGVLFLHYPELSNELCAESGICYGRSVNIALDIFLAKLVATKSGAGWKAFRSKYKLSTFWQKCLLLIRYLNLYCNTDPTPAAIASLLARNRSERQQYLDQLAWSNLLSRQALITPANPQFLNFRMELTEAALANLHEVGETSGNQKEQGDRLLAASAYLNRIAPGQRLEQLILDSATRELIVCVILRLKNPQRESIAAWGLLGASLTGDPKVQQGCNILLHGVPGTGKTFIAGVIANELKRPLVQINANSIRDMYYGATEKQARELFQEMRTLEKLIAPVFLLNEGDQLIHQRLEVPSHSADTTENAIQSVFLEELESFPGIVVVTTNLQSGLDSAMSRRFHYKLEIAAPDYESRKALWHLHLPHSIPGARDIAVDDLARAFSFTGGQIRLVVQNACHEAFLRAKGARLSLEDLFKYAALENGTSFEKAKHSVGFAR